MRLYYLHKVHPTRYLYRTHGEIKSLLAHAGETANSERGGYGSQNVLITLIGEDMVLKEALKALRRKTHRRQR